MTFEDRRTPEQRKEDRPGFGQIPEAFRGIHPDPPFTIQAYAPIVDAPDWVRYDWGFELALADGNLRDMTPRAPYLPEPTIATEEVKTESLKAAEPPKPEAPAATESKPAKIAAKSESSAPAPAA
jgi:hypothetical protein